VGELLRRGEKIPGFGHFVYRSGDPRAVVLLGLVRRAAPKSGQLAVAEAVLAEVRRKSLPEPNIDFAVATLARVVGMVPGAGRRYSRSPARPAGSPTPSRPTQAAVRYVPALSTPARLRSSTHDAVAVCYRFVT
jgi:Citrate synthase, C-terminal domain